MRDNNENDNNKRVSTLARRDLIKLGVVAGAAAAGMLKAPAIFAQQAHVRHLGRALGHLALGKSGGISVDVAAASRQHQQKCCRAC